MFGKFDVVGVADLGLVNLLFAFEEFSCRADNRALRLPVLMTIDFSKIWTTVALTKIDRCMVQSFNTSPLPERFHRAHG